MTAARMRVRKGRVMHRVERHTLGGSTVWYRSLCRRRGGSLPRADAPADEWSTERYWHPDCGHCPAEEQMKERSA